MFLLYTRKYPPSTHPRNPLLREKGDFYAYITGTDFFAGTSYGSNLQKIRLPPHYRNAVYRKFLPRYKTRQYHGGMPEAPGVLRWIARRNRFEPAISPIAITTLYFLRFTVFIPE